MNLILNNNQKNSFQIQMFPQGKQPNLHILPYQQVAFQNRIEIQSYSIDSEIKVRFQPYYFSNECPRKLCHSEENIIFKLQLRKQYLVLTLQSSNLIYQIYKPNFQNSFRLEELKLKTNPSELQLRCENFKQLERKLTFAFKDKTENLVQFFVSHTSSQHLNDFITKLRKICIEQQDFHRSFRPSRKLYSTQNYSLFRAKDLTKNREVVIKAYRKDNQQTQIWKQCETIVELSQLKEEGIIQNLGFFQTSNSVYIIFETFDYFLQNFSSYLNQKYKDSFSNHYEKKALHVLKIMQQIVKTMEKLHSHGFSMSGIFAQSNLSFKNIGNCHKPIINPYSEHLCSKDVQSHKNKLKQKVSNFHLQSSISQMLPPEHFQTQQWMWLDEREYLDYLTKSDVFGLGNVMHTLLFNQSVFGKVDKDDVNSNNRKGKILISNQIHQLKKHQPELVELIYQITSKQPSQRISLLDLKTKINEIIQIQQSKPITSAQSICLYENSQKVSSYAEKKKLINQAEKNNSQNSQYFETNVEKGYLERHIYPSKKVKGNDD